MNSNSLPAHVAAASGHDLGPGYSFVLISHQQPLPLQVLMESKVSSFISQHLSVQSYFPRTNDVFER